MPLDYLDRGFFFSVHSFEEVEISMPNKDLSSFEVPIFTGDVKSSILGL
jgi:hypothetical protein